MSWLPLVPAERAVRGARAPSYCRQSADEGGVLDGLSSAGAIRIAGSPSR
jgi:hypothetical protein